MATTSAMPEAATHAMETAAAGLGEANARIPTHAVAEAAGVGETDTIGAVR